MKTLANYFGLAVGP